MEKPLKAHRTLYVRLRREMLLYNTEKCSFGQPEVEFCEFIVVKNGITPQPSKMMAIYKWPQLRNAVDVKSFLLHCGFYQRFVNDYATVAAPLTDLMKKKGEWVW